ncbi:aconitate hydratase, putative, Aquifex type [Desulfosporosinus orientis DSM 765]|uniref:Aconitate hydratase, putative, Aquifex type n=1 Tax=Desulfosporosinus orientis (strain ATCC 19365 / DSM 765 / NCIMB 8382 / VKM B-1628 / Singapore I) TaxID=768706 RepID=G7WIN8_DESOD|nr:aconitate hydratase [Desulfosporosinus orientis]AET69112.1 aconitate hydratase, putative, Aquifex type [Desulfosporosinus orientis DSM 765]
MGKNLTQKILSSHLVSGDLNNGNEIAIRIDQTLTQDATGTMAYLQFEAMNLSRVQTECSVSYIDHNTLQSGFENADDHAFLQSAAARFGAYFSRPGNGICHQVHLERFAKPGKTLLGSDSHTPTAGGMGMLAMGAGGLDVAVAMGGGAFYLPTPKVLRVWLTGQLSQWVSAKDIILEILRTLTVKGGVGKIIEYAGPGVQTLTVPERSTITNMGAELGATSSIFPSDEQTQRFLEAQGRGEDYVPLAADSDAVYDEEIKIDLSLLVPLIAQPHSPDNVVPVSELSSTAVQQVAIGSCTNSSYQDLMRVSQILKGKRVHPNVSLVISPGSRQVLSMLASNGSLTDLLDSGARLLESTCGPCIGMGQSPVSKGVSVRTFNRNFLGRSGTQDASVFLASPEVAAACALTGFITDPRTLEQSTMVEFPKQFRIDDSMILPPGDPDTPIRRGPNIQPLPIAPALNDSLDLPVILKLGNNITTDDIMPAGSKILPLRSNIPAIAEFVFHKIDPDFASKAKAQKQSIIVAGHNYGQGSSREHAALAPMYLGLRVVLAQSFARIHRANLINFGILPLTFVDEKDLDCLNPGMVLHITDLRQAIQTPEPFAITVDNASNPIMVKHDLTERQAKILLAGGLLNSTKQSV